MNRLLITPDILCKLKESWEKDSLNPDCIMLWAASCTCFFGFLWSGEVTVPSLKEYDPEGHLSEGDVSLDSQSDPSVVRVHIKASKMDPFRKGVYIYLGKTGNELCPVAALTAYLAVRGRLLGPFFRFVSGKPLSHELFVKHIWAALHPYDNINVNDYSGHSFRIGAASAASATGIEDSTIKTLGRWQSAAYQSYVRIPRESLAAVSKNYQRFDITLYGLPVLVWLTHEMLVVFRVTSMVGYKGGTAYRLGGGGKDRDPSYGGLLGSQGGKESIWGSQHWPPSPGEDREGPKVGDQECGTISL